jgi:hypothetical protein
MMNRRNSSTIPFGYKLNSDNKTLEEVPEQLEALNKAKEHVKKGAYSLRNAVEMLEHDTGRKLSAMGLKKMIDKDNKQYQSKSNGLLSRNDKETI